ncbi:hypothetical protein BGLA2_1700021 [Burkholderia gladioli]|nr:hypothetical protein BGLA2_1700021 [Burkholderia gladioli]
MCPVVVCRDGLPPDSRVANMPEVRIGCRAYRQTMGEIRMRIMFIRKRFAACPTCSCEGFRKGNGRAATERHTGNG